MTVSPRAIRWSRLFVLAISLAFGIAYVILRSTEFAPDDTAAYWDAAVRLRTGQELYPVSVDPDAAEVYRYAPWFALIWVPLTFLPQALVVGAWWLVVLGATGVLLWRIARLGLAGLALTGLIGPFLIWIAGRGNVHPLILLPLVLGVEGRAGPVIVGAAASLKATPLAYALVYLGRRQFGAFATSLASFLVLTAPVLLFDTSGYVTAAGTDPNPIYAVSPGLWLGLVVCSSIATLAVAYRWPRYAWLVASLTATVAVMRFLPYSLTYLLVGVAAAAHASHQSKSTPQPEQ